MNEIKDVITLQEKPSVIARLFAVLFHLSFFFAPLILPFIGQVVANKKNWRFLSNHANQSMAFQMTLGLFMIVTMLAIVGVASLGNLLFTLLLSKGALDGFFAIRIVGPAFFMGCVMTVGALILVLQASVKALKGEEYVYPSMLPFFRPKETTEEK